MLDCPEVPVAPPPPADPTLSFLEPRPPKRNLQPKNGKPEIDLRHCPYTDPVLRVTAARVPSWSPLVLTYNDEHCLEPKGARRDVARLDRTLDDNAGIKALRLCQPVGETHKMSTSKGVEERNGVEMLQRLHNRDVLVLGKSRIHELLVLMAERGNSRHAKQVTYDYWRRDATPV